MNSSSSSLGPSESEKKIPAEPGVPGDSRRQRSRIARPGQATRGARFSRATGMLRQGGKSTSFVSGNKKSVHTTFENGSELVEEYDLRTDELLGGWRVPPERTSGARRSCLTLTAIATSSPIPCRLPRPCRARHNLAGDSSLQCGNAGPRRPWEARESGSTLWATPLCTSTQT